MDFFNFCAVRLCKSWGYRCYCICYAEQSLRREWHKLTSCLLFAPTNFLVRGNSDSHKENCKWGGGGLLRPRGQMASSQRCSAWRRVGDQFLGSKHSVFSLKKNENPVSELNLIHYTNSDIYGDIKSRRKSSVDEIDRLTTQLFLVRTMQHDHRWNSMLRQYQSIRCVGVSMYDLTLRKCHCSSSQTELYPTLPKYIYRLTS
jgi:hypothetical protein